MSWRGRERHQDWCSKVKFTLLACDCGADVPPTAPTARRFRVQILQLCGGGLHGERPYWPEVLYVGMRVSRAREWLKDLGWRPFGPLRLRLKGRCWIEDPRQPATARPLGEFCPVNQDRKRKDREAAELERHIALLQRQKTRRRRQRRPMA